MSIPFTQYLLPDGRTNEVTIDRPADVEAMAQAVIGAGLRFEAEEERAELLAALEYVSEWNDHGWSAETARDLIRAAIARSRGETAGTLAEVTHG